MRKPEDHYAFIEVALGSGLVWPNLAAKLSVGVLVSTVGWFLPPCER